MNMNSMIIFSSFSSEIQTVLKIITNFGPNFSYAENKCSVRTYQRIKSKHRNILNKSREGLNFNSNVSYFDTMNKDSMTKNRVINPTMYKIIAKISIKFQISDAYSRMESL